MRAATPVEMLADNGTATMTGVGFSACAISYQASEVVPEIRTGC